jgi:mannitol-1-phosphate 5-dehydrogenase
MPKAIHFGAGKIGRGFIGAVLREAGYDVVFADVNQEVIDLINKEGKYTVHITDKTVYQKEISGISAVNSSSEKMLELIAEADLLTTAVSLKVLPFVAPVIAKGLESRKAAGNMQPMNIICCENGIRATSTLKGMVEADLDDDTKEWTKGKIGFADSSVDRIVPMLTLENPLDVAVEEFYEWNVDQGLLVGELLPVSGMNLTDNLDSCVEKKLFTLNTGHCTTAFLGMMKGYTYIHEAVTDPAIQEIVRSVMHQSGAALIKKFGIDPEYHANYVDIIISRFSNPHLQDLVARVGSDPVRKLGGNLYFAYPIKMAMEFGLPYDRIAVAAAAALHCDNPKDPQSVEIRQTVAEIGPGAAFSKFSGITDEAAIAQVAQAYETIRL